MSSAISKIELQVIARERLEDAQALLRESRWSAAYYLAGYAIELALKACIANQFLAGQIPDKRFVADIYTHNPNELLKLSGLKSAFEEECDANAIFAAFWVPTSQWRETSRYESHSEKKARSLVDAIGDPTHGVFAWLTKHW